MVEIILLIFVIPKMVTPLTKSNNRGKFQWLFLSLICFLTTEFSIVWILFLTAELLTIVFVDFHIAEIVWLVSFVKVIGLVGGLLSVNMISRYLYRQSFLQTTEPPPPPSFS